MAFFPRPASPAAAWRDMTNFLRQRRRHQIVFATLAVAIPIIVMFAFLDEFTRVEIWKPPPITYVKQWSADRTRAEIAAQQARDLPAEQARRKRLEQLEAERRAQFKRLKDRLSVIGI